MSTFPIMKVIFVEGGITLIWLSVHLCNVVLLEILIELEAMELLNISYIVIVIVFDFLHFDKIFVPKKHFPKIPFFYEI